MKTISQIPRVAAILVALGFAGLTVVSAADKKPDAKPADLQVTVYVPPTWRPFLDDDIAETFAYRLSSAFKHQGYAGKIMYLDRIDNPTAGVPLLNINLVEWRIDRTGYAQCTFSASLKDAKGEHELGLTNRSAIFWPRTSGRWGINRVFEKADALEDAADTALRDFYRRIAKDNLLPMPAAK